MADTDRTQARKARSGDLGSMGLAVNPEIPSIPGGTAQGGVSHVIDQRVFTCWVLLAAEGSAATATDQAFAWFDRPITIISARVLPQAAVTANDSNYATVAVQYNNDAGGALTPLASASTAVSVKQFTGSWTANQSMKLVPLPNLDTTVGNFTVPAGGGSPSTPTTVSPSAPIALHFTTAKTGTGVVIPASLIELVWQEI